VELDRFMESHRSSIARDVDNAAVYLAESQYSLRYEEERWEKIKFDTVKDYQKKAE
jgi:peptide chain release factor 3